MTVDFPGYRGKRRDNLDREAAEGLALQALAFLAGRPEALDHFFGITGLRPETIRDAAADPTFLPSVLDHFLADEPLLIAFAAATGLSPESVPEARRVLGEAA